MVAVVDPVGQSLAVVGEDIGIQRLHLFQGRGVVAARKVEVGRVGDAFIDETVSDRIRERHIVEIVGGVRSVRNLHDVSGLRQPAEAAELNVVRVS